MTTITLDRAQIQTECTSMQQIEALIRRFPMEEIWLSGESAYPCLVVQTNANFACITYFHSTGVMWMSHGGSSECLTFYAGGELWEAPSDAVISLTDAILCCQEFYRNHSRPTNIRWQEL